MNNYILTEADMNILKGISQSLDSLSGLFAMVLGDPRLITLLRLSNSLHNLVESIEEANDPLACRSRVDYISEKEKSKNETNNTES